MTESQRAMVAASLAKLPRGDVGRFTQSANLQTGAVTAQRAGELLHVGTRSVQDARLVSEQGTPELAAAVQKGEIAVSTAAVLTELPKEE
ncbi:MAG: hypothetical protein AB1664_11000 [Thermodesulfobacteriota bacterium]